MARATKVDALETRARLLDAAMDVFHARGVEATTLDDIAREAGVTRGAIYWHFKNKSDLFSAMFEQIRLPMGEMLEANIAANPDNLMHGLVAGFTEMLVHSATETRWFKTLDILFNKCEVIDQEGAVGQREKECRRLGRERIDQIIREAIAKGQLPPTCDSRRCSIMLNAVLTGLFRDWFREPGMFDMATEAEKILRATIVAMQLAPTMQAEMAK